MKAFRLIGMALVAMCLCMNFVSCSNEDVVAPEDPQAEKYVTVGLGCTGEFLEFSESAMGRTATDELYGIQVYALTERTYEGPEGSYTHYEQTPYAYGLFSSLENVKIRLLQGQKYKFEVGIVIDPFKHGNLTWFGKHYDNSIEFTYSSTIGIRAEETYYWQSDNYLHDRYYGVLEIYNPEEYKTVDIQTKRVAYGVRYETIGLNSDETFRIEVSKPYDSYSLYCIEINNIPNDNIYSFQNIISAWNDQYDQYIGTHPETGNPMYETLSYRSEKKLTISWKKADGSITPMGAYTITFKRNVKTTIRIHAEDLNLENGIKVYKEETPMADDEYIYDITGGKVEEVPVNSGN